MVNKLLPSLLLQWGEGGSGLGGPSHLPCPYSLAGGVGGGGRDSGRGLTPLLPHPTPTPRSPGSPGALRRAESRSGGGGCFRGWGGDRVSRPGVPQRGARGSPGAPARRRTWRRGCGPAGPGLSSPKPATTGGRQPWARHWPPRPGPAGAG